MDFIPYYDIDYCQYSDWGYRKRTRIWTNVEDFKPLICPGINKCSQMIPDTKCHKISGGNSNVSVGIRKHATKELLYRIPSNLIISLFQASY